MSQNIYDPETGELYYLGRGFAFPFNFDDSGGVEWVYNRLGDYPGIKMTILHILGCHVGRRRMLRDFGGDLHKFLFEPLVEELVDDVVDYVERAITKWEPRVTLQGAGMGVSGKIVIPMKKLEILTNFTVIKTQQSSNLVMVLDADLKRIIPILNAE